MVAKFMPKHQIFVLQCEHCFRFTSSLSTLIEYQASFKKLTLFLLGHGAGTRHVLLHEDAGRDGNLPRTWERFWSEGGNLPLQVQNRKSTFYFTIGPIMFCCLYHKMSVKLQKKIACKILIAVLCK